ncbi:alkaline phosphatase family protein [Candidatus Latescibacterota bacterium]
MRTRRFLLITFFATAWSAPACAYIGPGAGFAIVSSFLSVLAAFAAAFLALLFWPLRRLRTIVIRRRHRKNRRVRRVIVLGFDGFDPTLAEQYMNRGILPHFQTLAEGGSFTRLRTTFPAISPVVWSTFATGVNPGKHRIFDFYTRDPRTYAPVLTSARISSFTRRIGIGPLKLPLRRTAVSLLRKSTPFWRILGDARVFSSINRVPVTYPPERFYGVCLAAMCAPDLRGTQGSFTLLCENGGGRSAGNLSDGTVLPLEVTGNRISGSIPGPTISQNGTRRTLTADFTGSVDRVRREVRLNFGRTKLTLREGEYSPWTRLTFRAGMFRRITGIARFMVTETTPHLSIYVTPINIDPERPALQVSHPSVYSNALAKLYGAFATLGLAEDTWALNEHVIDEDAFLTQCWDIFEERRRHLLDSLAKNRDGLVATVFDTTDRIQHMFFRYLSDDHPANEGRDTERLSTAIEDLYRRMDGLLGEVLEKANPDDLVLVVSDHGFAPFKWGVNLNSWLWREGYLVLRDGVGPGGKWFQDVDWRRTRAYAYGLAGIFLNVRGRERDGIVESGEERQRLAEEIKGKLELLVDEKNGKKPIRRVMLREEIHHGPYMNEAHDLFIGYDAGWRASWNSAVGMVTDEVFEANTKSWSGDHCIDPEVVPGVLFSNWRLEEKSPSIMDLAPTIVNLFGLPPQKFHDGSLLTFTAPQTAGDIP